MHREEALMEPCRNWFHCTGSMYGQWFPGSDKGWRGDHRRHVDADYRHRFLKGAFKDLKRKSEELLKKDPVELTYEQRVEVCKAVYQALIERGVEVAELSIGKIHWHGVTRFVPIDRIQTRERDPKLLIGAAKGPDTLPIEERSHFSNSKKYIHDHVLDGAAVLSELIKHPEPQP